MKGGIQAALRHKGVRWIGLGWTGFVVENLVLSENRTRLIQELGESTYHITYSVLSTAACGSIGYGFFKHGQSSGPRLARVSRPAKIMGLFFHGLGFVGLFQLAPTIQLPFEKVGSASKDAVKAEAVSSFDPKHSSGWRPRCPFDFSRDRSLASGSEGPKGLERVTRHVMFWSIGFCGLGSALVTPFASEIVFYAMPAVFAAVGGMHQDSRFRRGIGGTLSRELDEATSCLPFVALITGKQSWEAVGNELKELNALIGVLAALALAVRRVRLGF